MPDGSRLRSYKADYRDRAILVLVAAFPLFFLTIKGWTNTLLFALVIASLIYVHDIRAFLKKRPLGVECFLVMAALASGVVAVVLAQTFRGEYALNELDGPARMLAAVPVFLMLLARKINFVQVFQYVCPASLFIIAFAVFFFPVLRADERIATYFVDPITLGNYALVLGFMSFFGINSLGKDRAWLVLMKTGGLACAIAVSLWSQSRSGWLMIPVLLIMWFIAERKRFTLAQGIAVTTGTLGIVFSAYLALDFVQHRVQQAFGDVADWWSEDQPDTSVGFRLTMWQLALILFFRNPLSGYGDQGYLPLLESDAELIAVASLAARTTMQTGPHNEILAGMLQSGIFGLVSKLLLFFVPMYVFARRIRSSDQSVRSASLLGLCLVNGLFISGFFGEQVFYLKFLSSFYGLMIASLCATALADREEQGEIHDYR